MIRDDGFEILTTPDITPDLKRIRQLDENRGRERGSKTFMWRWFAIFAAAAVAAYFVNWILAVVLAVPALIFLVFGVKALVSMASSKSDLIETYTDGLLAPAIIVRTHPTTLLCFAGVNKKEGFPPMYACFSLIVEKLPGAKGELYEHVPCSVMYQYELGTHFNHMQASPLSWATGNAEELQRALATLDRLQTEGSVNAWEVLEKLAKLPLLYPNAHMILLDDAYQPAGIKQFWDDEYLPCVTEKIRARYKKGYPLVKQNTEGIPAAAVYNKMAELAVQTQAYEYISTPVKDEYSGDGLLTYFADPKVFLEAVKNSGTALAAGEIPLIYGRKLITTKGVWKGTDFQPWNKVNLVVKYHEIEEESEENEEICIALDGKDLATLKLNTSAYDGCEGFTADDKKWAVRLDREHVNEFLQALRTLG